jgi:hypothetical protein
MRKPFKLRSSPTKLWVTAGKQVAKQGTKQTMKKAIKRSLTGAGIAYEGYAISESYKKKSASKPWYRRLGEAVYDETVGFGTDVLDIVGSETGAWNPKSKNYPFGGGVRRNMTEQGWDEHCPECEYDDKTSTAYDPVKNKRVKVERISMFE